MLAHDFRRIVAVAVTAEARGRKSAAEILEDARLVFEPTYREIVGSLPERIARIGGYHIGWWDAHGLPMNGGGKVIRPALVLTTTAALSTGPADAARERAVAAAVAVEMVHDFSLLHDDIMDGDRTRRDRPTAWAQFGHSAAMLTGDLFLTVAMDVLAAQDTVAVQILSRALRALCAGQSEDLSFENRQTVSLSECVRMAEGKTAALLGASCELGAWAAGADSDRLQTMRQFGLHLGLAYQLVDDLLGIWGDPSLTGKPIHADLARRKKSLPVVAALNSATPASAELASRYADPEPLDPTEQAHLARLIERAGGRDWAEHTARENCAIARRILEHARPEPGAAADLLSLVDLITHRDR
ncbi:polyprenyl synthetase family protein [Nocardia sp. NPDC051929]|uniref:polyprenyl synthetase family protein n=1 Tax=unclassified Nocardia TaxID=2637762 RepID=UPI0034409A5A